MNKLIAVLSLLFVLCGATFAQTKLLRHPSYHDGKVAFSYLGDIWVVNEDGSNLQRLTVHKAREVYPRFSPDGKWIAFSSNRAGNYDVYVIPATGGQAKQLTFNSASDTVVGWTPDSKKVIFNSARGILFPGISNLYEVSVEGGLEQPIPTDWGYWGDYTADGSKFVFNRHPMVWWRKHYRGSYAADLWVMDVSSKKFTHLNADDDYKGNNFWPMVAATGDIYFVADRLPDESHIKPGSAEVMKSINNIWKIPAGGGKAVQVTHHTDGNLFWPSISGDRKTIVYEEDFELWKLDIATGKTKEIKVNIQSDDKENMVETLTVRNDTEGYSLSPSNKRVAVSAHGEIFTVAVDRGDVKQVTNSFSREMQENWSPDGKWIAYVSDKSGQDEVWISHEDGTGARKLTDAATEKNNIRWSPDAKMLLYSASDHKLYKMDVESGKADVVASNDASTIQGAQWSPDGKWIAYAKQDKEFRPHVFVIPSAGGEEKRVGDTESTRSETEPVWTKEGKKILFLGGDAQQGSAVTRRGSTQLYSVSLTKEDKNPADRGVDSEDEAVATPRNPRTGGTGGDGEGARSPEVKIDFDGIARRVRQLTRLPENITAAASSLDGHTYAFVAAGSEGGPGGGSSLYTINEDGTGQTRVAQSTPAAAEGEDAPAGGGFGGGISNPQYGRDGRTIYFLEGGVINYVETAGGAAAAAAPAGGTAGRGGAAAGRTATAAPATGGATATPRRVSFTVRVNVDHREEWKEVFGESWRIMRNRFYDAAMHGADWNAAKKTYGALMDYVGDQEEMHNVVSQMIGEINGSHTGISATPDPAERDHIVQTRYPGFELAVDASGYYKVSKIYKGGPADHDYVKVSVGDFILSIDGNALKSGDNYFKYYNAVPGQKMEFTVNSKPSADGAWTTKITPVNGGAYSTLQYEAWVADRVALVNKISNGQIGYLHIRSMNAEGLAKFEQDLVELQYKKGLIIDQRFNPGGGIDQELLEILSQHQYQRTRQRDSIDMTRPQRAYFGPMVVMENERSTSDAEVFPDGFRTLGLGKVVGVTTYGAVIGTGAYRLMDGSSVRTPGNGLWSTKGYDLENYGVPPDVYVDNTPEDFLAGRDAQVIKAVEVLKAQIK